MSPCSSRRVPVIHTSWRNQRKYLILGHAVVVLERYPDTFAYEGADGAAPPCGLTESMHDDVETRRVPFTDVRVSPNRHALHSPHTCSGAKKK